MRWSGRAVSFRRDDCLCVGRWPVATASRPPVVGSNSYPDGPHGFARASVVLLEDACRVNINATRPNQYRRTAPRVTPNRVAMRNPNRQNARGLPSRQPRHTCSVLHVGGGGALPVACTRWRESAQSTHTQSTLQQ